MIRSLTKTLALAIISLANVAQSQDLMGFDRGSFGSVVLSRTQAAGTDVQLEMSIGSYENEPISNYMGTIFADIGRSVGRLDVLTDKGLFPCTAFIVSKRHILTNYHCSLGLLDNEQIGATSIEATQFVAGYTQTGVDEGTKKYTVVPKPVEFSAELDYAVLEVIGNPSQEYGQLKLASLIPNDRAPFWIIGHPQGKGQHISREKCRASTPAVSRNKLLHTCDTLPGNSGSPVIDAGLQIVVGLHYAGISNDSVNAAILMSKILDNSRVLAAYKAPSALSTTDVEPFQTAEITPCDALYTAASEAKACFAYEAYFKSCRDHSLAPIADGYINEFCQVEETIQVDEAPKAAVVKKTCQNKFIGLGDYGIVTINAVATPSVCTDTTLCMNATKPGSPKVWHSRSKRLGYVKEAKKRGLTCGVEEKVTRSDGKCQGEYNVITWTDCTGTRTLSTGVTYMGSFKDGKYHGDGKFEFSSTSEWAGDSFVGQFKNGDYHGEGTYSHANGKKYTGQWNLGLYHGEGVYTDKDGQLYVGQFSNGSFNGQGTFTFESGDKYVGQFKDGQRHGQGSYINLDGYKHVGQFKNGDRHGSGSETYADGTTFVGEYKNDKRSGIFTVLYSSGAKYVGNYDDNKMHGQGVYTDADGTVKKGLWKKGKFQDSTQLSGKLLIKALQIELNRIGCEAGPADGIIGQKSRLALFKFTKTTDYKYDVGLFSSTSFLTELRKVSAFKCPDVTLVKLGSFYKFEYKCVGKKYDDISGFVRFERKNSRVYDLIGSNIFGDTLKNPSLQSLSINFENFLTMKPKSGGEIMWTGKYSETEKKIFLNATSKNIHNTCKIIGSLAAPKKKDTLKDQYEAARPKSLAEKVVCWTAWGIMLSATGTGATCIPW